MKVISLVVLLTLSVASYAANYVVIGAFAIKGNAEKLTRRTPNSQFDINPVKNLYYVFVLKTEDREAAFTEARRLQSETRYKDAWVFSGMLGEGGHGEDIIVPAKQEPVVVTKEPDPVVVEIPKEPEVVQPAEADKGMKEFFFAVTREDGTNADGADITVIDPTTQRKEYEFKGNENVKMKPVSESGDVRFECELVGYRKIVHTINYENPTSEDGIVIEENRIVVPFQLVPLKKGDLSILYDVFFFKDAAIMRPESKFDLDQLLAMMNANPKYKIKIHGHTNGSNSGPILEMKDAESYFTLTGAKNGSGSAKKLSLKRAEVIKEYLAKQGIAAERMELKAWGGKKPLYDKYGNLAAANVRVEIEVLED